MRPSRSLLLILALSACSAPAPVAPTPPPPAETAADAAPPTPTPDAGVPEKPALESPVLASLERTACFGFCPVYTVTVHADGSVDYHGERFVVTQGDASGQLTAEQMTALRRAFADAGWDGFETDYTHRDVTDNPSAIIRFEDKTVSHYHGDHSAPEALTKLEDRFDQIVDVEQWIGTPDQRSKLPRRR